MHQNRAEASPQAAGPRVLVLQGGGALGAYQAGAFESLAAAGELPDWVAGVSIGAINASLIAGNPPERRVDRLRLFWERVSSSGTGFAPGRGNPARQAWNEFSAMGTALSGVPGFFAPRFPPPSPLPVNQPETVSYYDTQMLAATLRELVDFDLLNSGSVRLSVGAVELTSGNSVYFDTRDSRVGIEHIMASGALPPGFPPVKIGNNYYWDGGLVSNSPLQYVIDSHDASEALTAFQVDLFSARGSVPRSFFEIEAREKEIRFSSRTRFNTDKAKEGYLMRQALHEFVGRLDAEKAAEVRALAPSLVQQPGHVAIMHLIYRRGEYETAASDYEFSRASMQEHWQAGIADAACSLADPRWRERQVSAAGFTTFDLASKPKP